MTVRAEHTGAEEGAAQPAGTPEHEELLTQYRVLRDEILTRIRARTAILTFTLLVAGTFLTLAAEGLIQSEILLVYPLVAAFLAGVWAHNDVRIWDIARYTRERIEDRLSGIAWESWLKSEYSKRRPVLNLTELPAMGLFVGSQLLAMGFAAPGFRIDSVLVALLVADCVAVAGTVLCITRRRGGPRWV